MAKTTSIALGRQHGRRHDDRKETTREKFQHRITPNSQRRLFFLFNPWVDGLSIVWHVATHIWKNITGTQHSDNAQSVPALAVPRFSSGTRANGVPTSTAARNIRAIACRSLG
jgi:hypothetical protein